MMTIIPIVALLVEAMSVLPFSPFLVSFILLQSHSIFSLLHLFLSLLHKKTSKLFRKLINSSTTIALIVKNSKFSTVSALSSPSTFS